MRASDAFFASLAEAEANARGALLHAPVSDDGLVEVRTIPEVIDSAVAVWTCLPGGGDGMVLIHRLVEMASSMARTPSRAGLPLPASDLLEVSESLERAEGALEGVSLTATEAHRARAALLHTVNVCAQAVRISTTNLWYARPAGTPAVVAQIMRDSGPRALALAEVTGSLQRLTRPASLGGRPVSDAGPDPLTRALARWDVQAHRAMLGEVTPASLVMVCAGQAALHAALPRLLRVDPRPSDDRLHRRIQEAQARWHEVATFWVALRPVAAPRRDDPLPAAYVDLRQSLGATLVHRGDLAPVEVVARRVNLDLTRELVHQSLASSVNLAHAVSEAGSRPSLRVSARAANAATVALMPERPYGKDPRDLPAPIPPRDVLKNAAVELPGILIQCRDCLTSSLRFSTMSALNASLDVETARQRWRPSPTASARACSRPEHRTPGLASHAPSLAPRR